MITMLIKKIKRQFLGGPTFAFFFSIGVEEPERLELGARVAAALLLPLRLPPFTETGQVHAQVRHLT